MLMMAGLGLGLGIIISSLTTKYRDLRFLVQFGVTLLMYATPVIYPALVHPGALPLDHPGQPDDAHRRDLPLCVPGRGLGGPGAVVVQFRLHGGDLADRIGSSSTGSKRTFMDTV